MLTWGSAAWVKTQNKMNFETPKERRSWKILALKLISSLVLQIESHALNSYKTFSQDLSMEQILILAFNDMAVAGSDRTRLWICHRSSLRPYHILKIQKY